MSDSISRQKAIDKINERQRKLIYRFGFENDAVKIMDIAKSIVMAMPSAQAEPTRIISETRAIPSDDDRVSLSEKVTATYYDEENEEWSRKIVTVRDVLDSVCDEYTVLPSAQPDNRLSKIAELLEGTIDHFDLDDAMDLLYQIKDVLR